MLPVPVQAGFGNDEAHVAGVVGFIGKLSGVVYVYTTQSFARRITATLLGLKNSEVEEGEMVNDAMGEMANMLVGQMKSRLTDRGIPCVAAPVPAHSASAQAGIRSVAPARRIAKGAMPLWKWAGPAIP